MDIETQKRLSNVKKLLAQAEADAKDCLSNLSSTSTLYEHFVLRELTLLKAGRNLEEDE